MSVLPTPSNTEKVVPLCDLATISCGGSITSPSPSPSPSSSSSQIPNLPDDRALGQTGTFTGADCGNRAGADSPDEADLERPDRRTGKGGMARAAEAAAEGSREGLRRTRGRLSSESAADMPGRSGRKGEAGGGDAGEGGWSSAGEEGGQTTSDSLSSKGRAGGWWSEGGRSTARNRPATAASRVTIGAAAAVAAVGEEGGSDLEGRHVAGGGRRACETCGHVCGVEGYIADGLICGVGPMNMSG